MSSILLRGEGAIDAFPLILAQKADPNIELVALAIVYFFLYGQLLVGPLGWGALALQRRPDMRGRVKWLGISLLVSLGGMLVGMALLRMGPRSSVTNFLMGQGFLAGWPLALMALVSALDRPKKERYIVRGLVAFRRGNSQEALRLYSEGLARFPSCWELLANRSSLYLGTGRVKEALADIEAALQVPGLRPDQVWGLKVNLVNCLMQLNFRESAEKEADLMLADYPLDIDPGVLSMVYKWRAVVRLIGDRPGEALPDVQRAIQLDPRSPQLQELKADIEQAIREGVEPPTELDQIGQRGCLHLQQGRFQEAMDCFNRLLELDPKHAKGYQLRGAVHHQLGNFEQELVDLTTSYELDGNEVALFNRGNCYVVMGRIEEGLADFEQFLKIGKHAASVAAARELVGKLRGS